MIAHKPQSSTGKRDIVLVRPQNLYGMQIYPPLGLIQLGTTLSEAGYRVDILVNDGSPDFTEKLINKASRAMFTGLTVLTAEVPDAIALCRSLRNALGAQATIVWGGWHATLFPDQLSQSDLVDFAVIGDGEAAAVKITDRISRRSNEGHITSSGDKLIRADRTDLNLLTTPRYDLVPDIESYITRSLTDKFLEYYQGPFRWLPYESSRGCPFDCAFCVNGVVDHRGWKPKRAEKVVEELAEIVPRHRLTHVKFIDDLFFTHLRRVREIFEGLKRRKVSFTWDAECRVDWIGERRIDDRMLEYLKANGLMQLTFGIESGSLDTLRRMRKGGKAGPERAVDAIERCSRLGIPTRGSFILDIPGDTPEDIFATVKLIRRLRGLPRFACGVHTYRPYPRSPLAEQLLRENKLYQPSTLEEWSNEESVRQYTDTTAQRKWQDNYRLSSRVSFYESLESAFWLKPHQMSPGPMKWINDLFIGVARIRNQRRLYGFPLDRHLYIRFKDYCTRHMLRNAASSQ